MADSCMLARDDVVSSRSPARRRASAARPRCGWRATARRSSICARRARPARRGRRGDRRGRRPGAADRRRRDARGATWSALVARAVERFGRLDVMMCNAGFGIAGAIDDIAPEQMQQADGRQLHRHLSTPRARRCRCSAARRRGHLIIVSSIVGKRGVPYMGAYAATKFAQVGLAECLRAELAGIGHPRQRRLSRSRPTPSSST